MEERSESMAVAVRSVQSLAPLPLIPEFGHRRDAGAMEFHAQNGETSAQELGGGVGSVRLFF